VHGFGSAERCHALMEGCGDTLVRLLTFALLLQFLRPDRITKSDNKRA
jgi:hypothetical protein